MLAVLAGAVGAAIAILACAVFRDRQLHCLGEISGVMMLLDVGRTAVGALVSLRGLWTISKSHNFLLDISEALISTFEHC